MVRCVNLGGAILRFRPSHRPLHHGIRMPSLTFRIQSVPRDGSCRRASVTDVRVSLRGFALQADIQFIGCQPALDDRFHAGFRMTVRTP
jgi:hypothetical protein